MNYFETYTGKELENELRTLLQMQGKKVTSEKMLGGKKLIYISNEYSGVIEPVIPEQREPLSRVLFD
ncbi:MAG: hypothetical protein IPN97_06885 [Saprospiraceae bacterium]|nr:hypothetical protein [Saprospiraceae bacterium]